MALSMDEQRILDEIERGLGNADPRLAARLSSFGFKRPAFTLRTRRARVAVSCITLVVVAALSLVVYSLVPFRTTGDRHATGRSSASPRQPTMTVPHHPSVSPSASALAAGHASQSAAPSTGAARPVSPPSRAQ